MGKGEKSKSLKERFNTGELSKFNLYRALQIFFYCLGFPLVVLLAASKSSEFLGKAGFDNTGKNAILTIILIWAIVSLLQVVFNHFKKGFASRVIFIISITLVFMIGTALILQATSTKKIDTVRKEAITQGYNADVPNAKKQMDWFKLYTNGSGYASNYAGSASRLSETYNVGINPSAVRPGQNTDNSASKLFESKNQKELKKQLQNINISMKDNPKAPNYFFDGDAYYNVNKKGEISNGLYSDGFIFGVKQVKDIIKVNTIVNEYIAKNPQIVDGKTFENADLYLAHLKVKQAQEGSEYQKYLKEGKVKKEIDAYQKKYTIDEAKLNEILQAVLVVLGEELQGGAAEGLNLVLTLGGLIGLENIDKINDLIQAITGSADVKVKILALLSDFSTYRLSGVKPVEMFISNDELGDTGISMRDYALAQYYGRVHGGNIGSVILPNKEGKIGKITMDSGGKLAAENQMTYQELEQLMVDSQYKPTVYPRFLVRRLLLVLSGVVAFFMALSTLYGTKARMELDLLVARAAKKKKNSFE